MKIVILNDNVIGVYTSVVETDTEYQCDNTILPKSVVGICSIVDGEATVGDIYDGTAFSKPSVVPAIEVPQSITPRQARLALLQVGLLDDVEALLALDKAMQIWWEYSLEVDRNNPHIVNAGLALGMTAQQLDELFVLGATL